MMNLTAVSTIPAMPTERGATFIPKPLNDLGATGLNVTLVESLVLKYLMMMGVASGRKIAEELGVPYRHLFPDFFTRLKTKEMFLAHENALPGNDFEYKLTEAGRNRAMMYYRECAYVGTAPVLFDDYLEAVAAQSITFEHPKEADLRRAFNDLLISEDMFKVLGPAINSGRGMFLYGYPGNGKTSIAERITRCFGSNVWIPRVIFVEGQYIKLYDPVNHEPVERPKRGGLLASALIGDIEDHDKRWVEIRRPTLVAGGELTMDNLEIHYDPETKISEAPLQMKSNMGTLLIDDFGRQRMAPVELLNRWIVPLEKRYDFLKLANGKKVRVPFDQLIIFSTNLEPKQLVDEAFLRRIPYKIEAKDPTEGMFKMMIEIFAPKLGFTSINWDAVETMLEVHFRQPNRAMRCCHPRDLLLQIRNYCVYHNLELEMRTEYFDQAVQNYFTVM